MSHDLSAHTLLLYSDERTLFTELMKFISEGLQAEETVVVIAAEDHRAELRRRLLAQKIVDVSGRWEDRYCSFDAADTLALYLVGGWPDERLFFTAMGHFLESIPAPPPLRIYSEMVALLWNDQNYQAALHLEELWSTLAEQRQFTLICGYPTASLDTVDPSLVQHLHRIHSERSMRPGGR